MRKYLVNKACVVLGAVVLASCSQEVMNFSSMEPESHLTVLTRGDGDGEQTVISNPLRLYVFDSEGRCTNVLNPEDTSTPVSLELKEGSYDVFAIGGADDTRLTLPSQDEASKTSVLSLKEGQALSDLMIAHSNVTLSKGDNNTMTLDMERKVCQIVSATINNVPEGTESVSISISPLQESILLNGTYQGEHGCYSLSLEKQPDGTTWKSITECFILPSVGKPTITVKIGADTYSYTCQEELAANYKLNIEGNYSAPITLSGTINGVAWTAERSISFTFDDSNKTTDTETGESGSDEGENGDDSGESGGSDASTPVVGGLYKGCYVLAVEGNQVTILSSVEKQGIIPDNTTPATALSTVNEKINHWSDPNIDASWRLATYSDAILIGNLLKDNLFLSELFGIKRFFYIKEGNYIDAFWFNNSTYAPAIGASYNKETYLRPVATLTFK